jgi:D-serine deaminase-like pyridoxal phosphate-dependent protein
MNDNWYRISNIDEIDSPSLVVYHERVISNIDTAKSFVSDPGKLRPHVKTHKSGEVTKLLLEAGISKFKCATIAEAEMLALADAQDVLLAYQPVGPKIDRLIALIKKYPNTKFSCLIDAVDIAGSIHSKANNSNLTIPVFIDLNVGMNRTGILSKNAYHLYTACSAFNNISIVGLHAYDGHLRDTDLAKRTKRCDEAFSPVDDVAKEIMAQTGKQLEIAAGGTPTFPIHAKRKNITCCPGTFIYWDKGYQLTLPEQPFLFAALLIARVISLPDEETICIDLGHKSVASENTLDKRVYFLNAPDLQPIGHSEEHMILKTGKNNFYKIGDVLYGVPHHICPTVALYERSHLVRNKIITEQWNTFSRNRIISI